VSPATVWYARVLLLFTASAGLLLLALDPSPSIMHSCQRWNHTTILIMVYYQLL
jgi:hypothetical protein